MALALLRGVLKVRKDLKVILMSATLDAELFSDYFNGAPAIKIPGFTYPVTEFYLDGIIEMTGVQLRPRYRGKGGYGGGGGGGGGDGGQPSQKNLNKAAAKELDPQRYIEEADEATKAKAKPAAKPKAKKVEDTDDWETLADSGAEDSDGGGRSGDDADAAAPTEPVAAPAPAEQPDVAAAPEALKRKMAEESKTTVRLVTTEERALELQEEEYDEYHQTTVKAIESSPSEVNTEMLQSLVTHIINNEGEGAILVFVAGTADISRCIRAVESLQLEERIMALPLHASLTSEDQQKIFRPAPYGTRKVVVSTNVAETSITVDDVTHVIDTGRVKELRYDSANGMSCLVECWVSKASAQQRRGRAGRTRPGKCYRLYRKRRWMGFAEHQDPEILRVPLEQLCLKVVVMGCDVRDYLGQLLNAPDSSSVEDAIQVLHDLSAIDSAENVTPLGKHLADIPVDIRIGKFIIFASILGCLDSALTIAGCMSYRSFFLSPPNARDEATRAHLKFASAKSDHITLLNAFNEWTDARKRGRSFEWDFCTDNFLHRQTLNQVSELKKQFRTSLLDRGFISRENRGLHDANSDNEYIIKAALTAGLYPRVVRIANPQTKYHMVAEGAVANDFTAKEIKFFPKEPGRVFLHPSSINFRESKFESTFAVYHEKIMTSKVFLRDSTMVSAFPILFFGGALTVNHEKGWIVVDGWLRLKAPARIAVLINQLRKAVESVLEAKIIDPRATIHDKPAIRALIMMLKTDGSG